MKLNNRGWGYRAMIFLVTILLIFFGIAIVLIYRFYTSFNFPNTEVNSMEVSR